jgi:hypothetical protein
MYPEHPFREGAGVQPEAHPKSSGIRSASLL